MITETINPAIISKPLVDWKNPPTLENLKRDYTEAKPVHDEQVSKITTWLDNLHVRNKTPAGNTGGSRIQPKLIRKQAEWRYAALTEPFLSTPDLFNVSPVTWEDKKGAEQNQLILNHQFSADINKTRFIDALVRAAVDEGTAIIRTGWEFEEEEYEEEAPVVEFVPDETFAETLQELATLRDTNPTRYEIDVPEEFKQALDMSLQQGMPLAPQVIGSQMVTKVRTVYNRPTLEVCDYRNVIIDPTAQGDMSKASFVIYSFESSLSELRKDKRYKNLDQINITASSILGEPDYATDTGSKIFNFKDKPRSKFVVNEYWGYWDIDDTGMVKPFVAAWVGDTLIRMEESPFPDKKLPFETAVYLPVRQSVYGEPDGALLEDNQKIIGAVTRGMIDILGKSANGQTGVRKDMLDATNRRKFDKGLDYEFNPNVDPRQGVYMHTYPEIPSSAQFMLQLQNAEAEALTGVKSYSSGIGSQALGSVATGIRGALDAASKRELGILRRLSDCLVRLGRKIVSMNAVFLSDKEVIRITNDEFIQIDREDLAGNYDIRLSISTAEEDNNKAQELAFMLQTMGNTLPAEMSHMLLAEIAKLRKMPDLAKRIESYQPQPDPMQQEMQALALEKAKLELQALQVQIQLDQAKAITEQAKAMQYQAMADKTDLDFIEQESGVKQEREMELRAEQAKSQMELAQMKLQSDDMDRQLDLTKEMIKARSK